MVQVGSGCFRTIQVGSGRFRMVQDGSGWFRSVQVGSGWFRSVHVGSGWCGLYNGGIQSGGGEVNSSVIKVQIFCVRYLISDSCQWGRVVLLFSPSAQLSEPITASTLIKSSSSSQLTVSEFSCRCFNPQRPRSTRADWNNRRPFEIWVSDKNIVLCFVLFWRFSLLLIISKCREAETLEVPGFVLSVRL